MDAEPHAPSTALDRLDDALTAVRRALQQPGYRRQLARRIEIDVPLGVLRVVRAVQRSTDPSPTIGDVAELLLVDPSTASRTVDDAVSRGLLQRRPCERDRRRTRLSLTHDGAAALARLTAARRSLLGEVTDDWEPHEVDELVASLERLLAGFRRFELAP